MGPLIDIHTHRRAATPGVIQIANHYAGEPINPTETGYFSCGVHPWDADKWDRARDGLLAALANPKLIAIGECGLDRRCAVDIALQKSVFWEQATLARDYSKPVILHCVRAEADILEIHKKIKPRNPWVVHGFARSAAVAAPLIDKGFYFSFGRELLGANARALSTLRDLPISRVFLETDAADCAIGDIYRAAEYCLGRAGEEFAEILLQNFVRCFGFNPRLFIN